jgi:hypothetical protein
MATELSYTAIQTDNITRFNEVLGAYLGARADVGERLTSLLAEEPQMPMAVCLQGYLLKLAAHPKFAATLQTFVAQAQIISASDQCNDRERQHIQALTAWAYGHEGQALAILEDLLSSNPTDMCALRIAHYLHFYQGVGANMLASTRRVRLFWQEGNDHFGYYLGMHAFGLEESGDLVAAEQVGRTAAEINPADLWAVHAVDHALYTQGDHQAGIRWLRQHESTWVGTNNFRYHLYWHLALHHLKVGEHSASLGIYDAQLATSISDDFYLDMCNNAALLWRLEYRGVDVGDRWQALVEIAEGHTSDQELVFASLHYLLPLARLHSPKFANMRANFSVWSKGRTDQARVSQLVGEPIATTVANQTPQVAWQKSLHTVGGSHAQRELFSELT